MGPGPSAPSSLDKGLRKTPATWARCPRGEGGARVPGKRGALRQGLIIKDGKGRVSRSGPCSLLPQPFLCMCHSLGIYSQFSCA